MKRLLILLILIILAGAGGAYVYYSRLVAPREVPKAVLEAENAIALTGTFVIASVDMEYVKRIDREIHGKEDPSPLLHPETSNSFLGLLQKQGINPIKQTDYAISAISVSKKDVGIIVALLGDYSTDAIKQVIDEKYIVKKDEQGFWLIQTENTTTCKLSPPWAILIQKDKIIIASPEIMATVIERFKNKAPSDIDLAKWQEFRSDKIFAGAVIDPRHSSKAAPDFITQGILKKGLDDQPLGLIFAGAVVNLLPPQGLKLLANAHSTDSSWPKTIEDKYNKSMVEYKEQFADLPTLSGLMKYMSVKADGSVLRITAVANAKLLEDIQKVPGEIIGLIFSGMKPSIKGQDVSETNAERILRPEKMIKFNEQATFEALKPFDSKKAFYKPEAVAGPFGISVSGIGLLPTDNDIIEITIKAEGKGLSNLTSESMHTNKSSNALALSIISAEDNKGNNLLRKETCGKEINLREQTLNTSKDQVYEVDKWVVKSIMARGEKTIRLQKGVRIDKVVKVTGKVSLEMATSIKTEIINVPFPDKVIETDHVRMFLKDSTPHKIKYDLSGKPHHILAVRAKNANGQYLDSGGSNSSGNAMTGVKSITKRIKGKVASIEVVYAERMEKKDYAFEINTLDPKYGKPNSTRLYSVKATNSEIFKKQHPSQKYSDKECGSKQKIKLEPFLVCMKKFGNRWGRETGGDFEVHAPAAKGLVKNLQAVELIIDTLISADGTEKQFNKSSKVNLQLYEDTRYEDGKWVVLKSRFHDTNVSVYSSDQALMNFKVASVKGRVKIRLPKNISGISIGATSLGKTHKSKNGISAKIARFEGWATHIDLRGPVEKIVQLHAKAADGTTLYTGNDRITAKQINTWGLSKEEIAALEAQPKTWDGMITIYGKPITIDILYADEFDVLEYPFELKLP